MSPDLAAIQVTRLPWPSVTPCLNRTRDEKVLLSLTLRRAFYAGNCCCNMACHAVITVSDSSATRARIKKASPMDRPFAAPAPVLASDYLATLRRRLNTTPHKPNKNRPAAFGADTVAVGVTGLGVVRTNKDPISAVLTLRATTLLFTS